jgi:hypothetical protein
VQQGNRHRRLDGRRDLVHGVRAQQQKVRASVFDGARSSGKQAAGRIPLTAALQFLDFGKVNTVEDDPRRVQATQALPHQFVDPAIVGERRFPAHAAEQADGFHAGRRARVREPGRCATLAAHALAAPPVDRQRFLGHGFSG